MRMGYIPSPTGMDVMVGPVTKITLVNQQQLLLPANSASFLVITDTTSYDNKLSGNRQETEQAHCAALCPRLLLPSCLRSDRVERTQAVHSTIEWSVYTLDTEGNEAVCGECWWDKVVTTMLGAYEALKTGVWCLIV